MNRKIKKLFHVIRCINYNTLVLNFKYLPLKQAIRLPILVDCPFLIKKAKGTVEIQGKIYTGMIKFGYDDIGHFDNSRLRSIWEVAGKVVFKEQAWFGNGNKIIVMEDGELIIGENLKMAPMSFIIATKKIEIGDHCIVSWECQFLDTDFHHILNEQGEKTNYPKEVKIGNRVWITSRATFLKGANVPDGCIIGNGAVVVGKLPEANAAYSGNPAKLIKEGIRWQE
jgi:hypothetical protein